MAEVSFPVATTMAEAIAAKRAAAAFYVTRIEALQAVLNGPEAAAFEAALAAAAADGVPEGTSAATNIPALSGWFASVRSGLQADWEMQNAIATAPVTPPEPVVVVEP